MRTLLNITALALALAGCSSSTVSDRVQPGPQGGAGGNGGAAGSGNGGGGAGGSSAGGASGGGASGSGGSGIAVADASVPFDGPDGSCGATSVSGEHVTVTKEVMVEVKVAQPVALYIMLDQSQSMKEPYYPPNATKWVVAVNAINAFVSAPSSANIDVALKMFPDTSGDCTGAGYDVPMVPMGRLPGNAAAISNALNTMPNGSNTPIEGALRGATSFCTKFQQQNPTEKCIVVFITDGAPNGCAQDSPTLTGIAGNAFTQDKVRTFTFGMDGADFNLLNSIAQQGGTDCTPPAAGAEACSASDVAGFNAGIQALRDTVIETHTEMRTEMQTLPVACEFTVPAPPAGETFHPDLVNVQTTTAASGSQSIGQVPSAADCVNVASGWYYDDPTAPSKMVLCPETCATAQDASDTRVDILLGCVTVKAVPK